MTICKWPITKDDHNNKNSHNNNNKNNHNNNNKSNNNINNIAADEWASKAQ